MSATPICTAAGATRGCRSGAEEAEKESEAEQSDSIRTMKGEELRIGETNRGAQRGRTSATAATELARPPASFSAERRRQPQDDSVGRAAASHLCAFSRSELRPPILWGHLGRPNNNNNLNN